jgi:hypothetical protein
MAQTLRTRVPFFKPNYLNPSPIPTMPTDIETSRAFVKERTEKTRAAQATLVTDSAWTWPVKTLAQWDADVVSMDGTVPLSLAKTAAGMEADMLAARGLLDARLDAIHRYTMVTVGVMRVRAATLPGLREIVDDLSARGDSRTAIEAEAEGLIAAWEEWEQQLTVVFNPAPGKSLVDFKVQVEGLTVPPPGVSTVSLANLKRNYKAALTKWRRSEGLLNALYSRCEDDCVGWYAEATKVWLAGTPEGDMIRNQVPTSYNPPTPTPPVPPPVP